MKATSAGTSEKKSPVQVVLLCIVCKGGFRLGLPYGRFGGNGGGVCSRTCNEKYEKILADAAIPVIQ